MNALRHLRTGLIPVVVLCLLLFACASPPQAVQESPAGTHPPETIPLAATKTPAGALPLVLKSEAPTETPSPTPTTTQTPPELLRFAVIGDYGAGGSPEADVAALVKSWNPDFVITTGDNNYPDGAAETIDENIGQFYHEFISPYYGDYGDGADVNRFFPSLGNHDWHVSDIRPYLDYFTLPGNERYYDFTWGPVHFFALDSDSREPDGVGSSSIQAGWLQAQMAASTSPWNVVYFHHAPYSSGMHGNIDWMQWPFQAWGADLVLSGHDHTYERIDRGGLTYVVNGLGGGNRYDFQEIVEGSQVRYNADYGAVLVEASPEGLALQFVARGGEVIDTYTIE